MSDYDKMVIFGKFLTERAVILEAQLYSMCQDVKQPIDAVRLKYGHLENTKDILIAFAELYNGDINQFKKHHMSDDEEGENEDGNNESGGA